MSSAISPAISVVSCAATAVVSAIVCVLLILLIRPWLQRHALAKPNARSSHKAPTPQGGGIAVVAAMIVAAYAAPLFLIPVGAIAMPPAALIAATLLIAVVGAMADFHPINILLRFLLQMAAVALVIYTLPADLRLVPILPWGVERVLLVIGGLWFVNLVNFMDGLDWMTVAEFVPLAAALAVLGLLGLLPPQAVIMSLALCGAVIGFAFFNRPVARLFLGDVGSLPIGLVLGWLLVLLAGHGARTAALLLPLYYLADSTITLLRRLFKGEQVWQAHRTHFYQRATDSGFSVIAIVTRVFVVNLILGALALATVLISGRESDVIALLVGVALVAWLLTSFSRGRSGRAAS